MRGEVSAAAGVRGDKAAVGGVRGGEKRVLGKDSTADACVAGLGKGIGTARRGKADKSRCPIKVNTIQHDLCDILISSEKGCVERLFSHRGIYGENTVGAAARTQEH